MENTILTQLFSLLIYAASGMIIGIFFDIFRVLRKSFHTPDFITYIEDALFWLLTGFFLLLILFYIDNGEIRIYTILGLFIGILFYLLFISKIFIKVNVTILVTIKKVVFKILKILWYPISIIGKVIKRIIKPITFFVINIQKAKLKYSKKIHNNHKKSKKKEKNLRERRIFTRNVEKYK